MPEEGLQQLQQSGAQLAALVDELEARSGEAVHWVPLVGPRLVCWLFVWKGAKELGVSKFAVSTQGAQELPGGLQGHGSMTQLGCTRQFGVSLCGSMTHLGCTRQFGVTAQQNGWDGD